MANTIQTDHLTMVAKIIPMTKKLTSPVAQRQYCFVRPGWREKKGYQWVEAASLQAIAWEFLRRNQDYASQYFEYSDRFSSVPTFAHQDVVS